MGRSPLLYAYWLPFSDEMSRLPPTNDSRGEANAFAPEIICLVSSYLQNSAVLSSIS